MPDHKYVEFHLHALGLEEQSLVINDIEHLPGLVGMRATVSRDRLLKGNLERCVIYDLWKGDETAMENVPDPSGRTLEDNELNAMLFATLCLRKELEHEIRRRREYRSKVNQEIEGLTGSDGSDDE